MARKFSPRTMPEAQTFWEKTKLGELWLPVCVDSGRAFFPPRLFSPFTGGAVRWEQASGRATLASYVIVHRPAPGFEDETPYIVAIAVLKEGPRMLTNLPGAEADPDRLPIGAPLELTFETRGDLALPQFRLLEQAA